MTKLLIGSCNSQELIPSRFFWSTISIKNPYPTSMVRGDHPWDVVRNNRVIKSFLDSDCDILVKMDIDQTYPPDYFTTMVPLVEKYKVIGPVIYDRWAGNKFMPLAFESHDYPHLKLFDLAGKSGVVEVPYPHTNLFYAREVLEKIPPPWYEAYLRPDGLDRANHVDFSFLDKIKKAGYPIYLNLDVEVRHVVNIEVDRGIYELWNNK